MGLVDVPESAADYAGAYSYGCRRLTMDAFTATDGHTREAERLARLFYKLRDDMARSVVYDTSASRVWNRDRLTAAVFAQLLDQGVIELVAEPAAEDVFDQEGP